MNKETLKQTKWLEKQIGIINNQLYELEKKSTKLCGQYLSGTLYEFMTIDDEIKNFIKHRLKTKLEALRKEFEEL